MAGLRFTGVRKDYGEVRALRGLDLEVDDGELMVLAGPSGCGKTTALRVAAGLESPTEGSVHIGARDVTRVAPSARNVSMVFQSYALFPHLSVAENIGFGLAARGVRRAQAQERVRAAAERVGCEGLLARRPFELSGGERQRVALARALVREPDVFLLDEPLSNLDAQLRVQMRAELKLLHQQVGATMLYVTHDQVEAMTLGTRLAVLRDGALQQVGMPDEVYRRPANRFVATFVGSPSMNVLPGVVEGEVLRTGPFTLRVPDAVEGRYQGDVDVGIRPEDVRLAGDSDGDGGGGGVGALVRVVETAGHETFLHLDAEGHPLVARVPGGVRPAPGSSISISLPQERVYVFDRDSGETLSHARASSE